MLSCSSHLPKHPFHTEPSEKTSVPSAFSFAPPFARGADSGAHRLLNRLEGIAASQPVLDTPGCFVSGAILLAMSADTQIHAQARIDADFRGLQRFEDGQGVLGACAE